MSFSQVIIKNFLGNIRKYISFFLCNIFSIALFFVYATISFNDVMQEEGNEWMEWILPVSIVGISIFSIFFIVYAHSSFVKSRNKEFGVYLTLGMSSKDLKRLVNIENLVIEISSIAVGLLVGTVFSKISQKVILEIMDLENVEYQLDYRSYLVTLIGFATIFFIVFLITNFKMNKLDISSLLVASRKTEGRQFSFRDIMFGLLGVAFLVGAIIVLILIAADEELNSDSKVILLYAILMFLSVNLIISNGGNMLIHFGRKSKGYYKNMLSLSEIHYKYNQNKRILFTLSILSAMSIFLIASPFSLVRLTSTIVNDKINDIEYVSTSFFNNFDNTEIISDDNLIKEEVIEFVYLSKISNSMNITDSIPIVPVSLYNQRAEADLVLNKGECAVTIIDWTPGDHGFEKGKILDLYDIANQSHDYMLVRVGHDEVMTDQSFCSDSMVILSDDDYKTLRESVSEANIGYYHFINFNDWQETSDIVDKLQEKSGLCPMFILSKIGAYKQLKSAYSCFLFVASVLGILFFIAGGIVLYFRQYIELPETKMLFEKLFRIGITRREASRIISKELIIIFYVPLLFGIFMGVSFIYLVSNMFNGESILDEFMKNTFYVVICYIVLQSIFYLLTMIKYRSQLRFQ